MFITIIKNPSFKTQSKNYMDYIYGETDTIDIPKYFETYTLDKTLEDIKAHDPVYFIDGWFNGLKNDILTYQRMYTAEQHYSQFRIPKHSGGFRTINAPNQVLKELQRKILYYMTYSAGRQYPIVHAHNSAFAYVKGRSALDAMKIHQKNNSRWFLKLDIKDFFPSFTKDFILKQIDLIYPWCTIPKDVLELILDVCMLDDGLPQGAPTSPLLTNILMIPIDYEINKRLWAYKRNVIKYTRYADDLLISSRVDMRRHEIEDIVKDVLKDTPLKIKDEKTRYGSSAGRNWNLGMMLNKDNTLTIGYKKKRELKNTVYLFMKHRGETWLSEDMYSLQGKVSYMEHIEPEYTKHMLKTIKEKTDCPLAFNELIKLRLYN